ncbi:MAG: glycosyltransferase family 9 protein [Deltaproteobacteria bacterium]|nr:glycosyltransferase family 9 protein [Deltaproteobacteria bacterium]
MDIRRHHTLPEDIQNILIIQLGDIGDVVWSIPTFRAVKNAYPDANLSLLIREGIGNLFDTDPAVKEVFEVKRYQGTLGVRLPAQLAFLKRVREAGFDLVFDLRSDERGAFMARLTGAPFRASLVYRDAPFYRNRLFTHLVYPAVENIRICLGAAEQSLRIVRGFGIPTGDTVPKLFIKPEILGRMRNLINDHGVYSQAQDDTPTGFVTLNPFSRWSYKEWPLDNWVAIGAWLWTEYRLPAVIVGSAMERARAEALVKSVSGVVKIHNLAGETNLTELAALLSLSRLHVGVDSAAPHIAAAVGTPTITLYGPSDWRDWAPVGEQHQVVTMGMDCSPCHQKGCDGRGRSRCLENMSVDSVKEAIMRAVSPRQ